MVELLLPLDSPRRTAPAPAYLHVGAMKTGTTFLQNLLNDNRDRLAAAGVLLPGRTFKAQVRAAQDVLGTSTDPVIQAEAQGAWAALAAEMSRHRGRASLVSMEFLSHARADRVDAAFDSLGGLDVHVVLTVRDAASLVPAQWQTSVRSGHEVGWADFQKGVRRSLGLRSRKGRFADDVAVTFRRAHDVPAVLAAWGRHVPAERLHVVTVPPSGGDPRRLWERFAAAVDLDPSLCPGLPPANESLGRTSADLLVRINRHLGPVPMSDHNATVRQFLAGRVLSFRAAGEPRPRVDERTLDFALGWNARTRAAIETAGARVVGDLDDLPLAPTERHRSRLAEPEVDPTPADLLAAAEVADEALRALVGRRARKATRAGVTVADLDVGAAGRPHLGWQQSTEGVEDAAAELAALCRTAIELRRRTRGA